MTASGDSVEHGRRVGLAPAAHVDTQPDEFRFPPVDRVAKDFAARQVRPQRQRSAQPLTRLEQRDAVSLQRADPRGFQPAGASADDDDFRWARGGRETVNAPQPLAIAGGVDRAALRAVAPAAVHQLQAMQIRLRSSRPSRAFLTNSGSAISWRAAPTMSQTPAAIAASASAMEVIRPAR